MSNLAFARCNALKNIVMGSIIEKEEANANAVLVKGFTVTSSSAEVEKNTDCDMVTGHQLTVTDKSGKKVFAGLRGFMPLGAANFLIRQEDGQWVLVRKGQQIRLKKVNLNHQGLALLFDERGKLHYNQESPHYRSIVA